MEDLLQHLKEIFSDETNDFENQDNPQNDVNFDEDLDVDITLEELRKAVFHQKNKSACGLDNVCTEAIKASFDIVSSFLLNLVNQIFNSGEYPESWGLGIITPIFKSGDANQAKNYRGITVSNILSKISSQILLNRLTDWSEKHEFMSKNQFGFQKGKSTTDCIYVLHSIITKVLQSKEKLYCIFIDFEKAFDKIDRLKLWNKLITENVSSKMVLALKAMYKTVKACIKHNNSYSAFIDSKLGVKQGDPSSPMIFMMFINDLNENINNNLNGIFTVNDIKIFLLLYADDQVIFGKSQEAVQSMLSDIENYCNIWGLKINTSKTKCMIFEKGRNTNYDFYLNNIKLEVVTSFKYLGVYLFKNGNWNRTQKGIAEHASYALHSLFAIFNKVEISTSEKCKLFDSLVSSVLNYSSEIWGYHPANDIEKVHTKFCRKILYVRQSTNISGLYGKLGRIPFHILRKINMMKYWLKILNISDD